jgi:hypothetical protein
MAQPRFQAGAGLNWKSEPFFADPRIHRQLVSRIPYVASWNVQGFGTNLLAEFVPVAALPTYSLRADLEIRYDYTTSKWQYDPAGIRTTKDYKDIIFQAHVLAYRRMGKKVKAGAGLSFFNMGKRFTYLLQRPPDTISVYYAFQALTFSIAYPVWKERLWINHRLWYTIGGYPLYGHAARAIMLGVNVEYFFYQSKKKAG